jgi:N-(2-amino-2-carboxyethyl)-L-glutamate synthase
MCDEQTASARFKSSYGRALTAAEGGTTVTIISTPQEYNEENLYVDLRSTLGRPLFLKCEGFNFAGSVKLKAATSMVEAAERDGLLRPG